MITLYIEDIDMTDDSERKIYFNDKLHQCKTTEDFLSLKDEMQNAGYGNWFYTKRGNEINSIFTNVTRTSNGKPYFCDSQYGTHITKNDADAVAYDTVRDGTTRICQINSLYKYWEIH